MLKEVVAPAPRPMNKREAKFTTECKKWCIHNKKLLDLRPREMITIECKVSVGNKPFNFKSGIKDHQLPGLIFTSQNVWGYKPSDASMTQQLGDLFIGNETRSYIAIHWVRRGNKKFYLLDPVTVLGLIDDGKKSIDEKMAAILADVTGILK